MTPRDRNLATVLVVGVGLVFAGGLTWYLKQTLDAEASYVRSAKESLVAVQEMSGEYAEVKAKLDAAETRMGQFRASQINTHLEGWARDASMAPNLKEVNETNSQVVGRFKERNYRVEIRDVPYASLVAFFYKIETSPYPVRIKAANLKAVSSGEERNLNVNVELVAYSKLEGEG